MALMDFIDKPCIGVGPWAEDGDDTLAWQARNRCELNALESEHRLLSK